MNIGTAITVCMSKYATFSGRASRSEFWWFYLFVVLLGWFANIMASVTYGVQPIATIVPAIVNLIFVVPFIAAGTRRLHDIGKSGWWQLILLTGIGGILLIFWWATNTKPEGEKYK